MNQKWMNERMSELFSGQFWLKSNKNKKYIYFLSENIDLLNDA